MVLYVRVLSQSACVAMIVAPSSVPQDLSGDRRVDTHHSELPSQRLNNGTHTIVKQCL